MPPTRRTTARTATTPGSSPDEAVRAAYDAHAAELYRFALRAVGDAATAQDIVQETFLRAWRSRTTLRERSTARPWLYRIATNACLDTIARRRPAAGEEALATVAADPAAQPEVRAEATLAFDQALLAAVLLGAIAAVGTVGMALLAAERVGRVLPDAIVSFLTRVFGVLLSAIAVELVVEGITDLSRR